MKYIIFTIQIMFYGIAYGSVGGGAKAKAEAKKMDEQNGCRPTDIEIETVTLEISQAGFTKYDLGNLTVKKNTNREADIRGNLPVIGLETNPHMHVQADNSMHVTSGAVDCTHRCGPDTSQSIKGEYFHIDGKKGEFPGIFPVFATRNDSQMVAPSFGRKKTSFFLLNLNNLQSSERIYVPGRNLPILSMIFPRSKKKVFRDTSGGAYYYVDNAGRVIVPIYDRKANKNYIFILETENNGWKKEIKRVCISTEKNFEERKPKMIAVLPDYDGNMWFTFNFGYIGVISKANWDDVLNDSTTTQMRAGASLFSFAQDNLPFQKVALLRLEYLMASKEDKPKIEKKIEELFQQIRRATPDEMKPKIDKEFFIKEVDSLTSNVMELQMQLSPREEAPNVQPNKSNKSNKPNKSNLKKIARANPDYKSFLEASKYLKKGNGESKRKNTEEIQNSMCVGKDGVYVLSEFALYKFHYSNNCITLKWDPKLYLRYNCDLCYWNDFSEKPGHVNRGSGTTPTLSDSRFVSIGDNATGHIDLNVFSQTDGALVGKATLLPNDGEDGSACENSVVAYGDEFWMCNTYGYSNPLKEVYTKTPGGMEKFIFSNNTISIDPNFSAGNNLSFASAVPKLALCEGQNPVLYVYNQDYADSAENATARRYKEWGITAVNHENGQIMYTIKPRFAEATVIKKKLPMFTGGRKDYQLKLFNNMQCTFAIGPQNNLWVGTKRGFVRIGNL